MKIVILTFHPSLNCGAMLQAWALQKVLANLGHQVSFPKCKEFKVPGRFDITFSRPTLFGKIRNLLGWIINEIRCFPITDLAFYRSNRFAKKFFQGMPCTIKELEDNNDLIIVGSDQVWNERIAKTRLNFFLGEVFKGNKPIVGYALSWGDVSPSPEHLERLRHACQRFSYLTVRESYALPILQSITDKSVCQVVDPTLLLKAKDYEPLILQKRLEKQPYIVAYVVKRDEPILQKVKQVADTMGLKLVLIDILRSPREKYDIKNTWAVSPDRFLNYIKHAEYVIASSFHGCVFATLFKKPFVFLTTEIEKKETRPAILLESLRQSVRICSPETQLSTILKILQTPLPSEIDEWLDGLAMMSKSRLQEMLNLSLDS